MPNFNFAELIAIFTNRFHRHISPPRLSSACCRVLRRESQRQDRKTRGPVLRAAKIPHLLSNCSLDIAEIPNGWYNCSEFIKRKQGRIGDFAEQKARFAHPN